MGQDVPKHDNKDDLSDLLELIRANLHSVRSGKFIMPQSTAHVTLADSVHTP